MIFILITLVVVVYVAHLARKHGNHLTDPPIRHALTVFIVGALIAAAWPFIGVWAYLGVAISALSGITAAWLATVWKVPS